MSDGDDRVVRMVKSIPEGFVRTYGDIDPEAPRRVGRVLSTTSEQVPWQRVVRADGSLPVGDRQRELLEAEDIPMKGSKVDLDEARLPVPPGEFP